MTLEQLKERVEATCNKNGIFCRDIFASILKNNDIGIVLKLATSNTLYFTYPNTDLLIEAVDLECRAIKARQSSATNGIDE